jgi:hypothetical protein
MENPEKIVGLVIEDLIEDVMVQGRFRRYFKACNSDASLDELLESARKHFPSFASDDLKRKYSTSNSSVKKNMKDLNQENFLRCGKRSGFSELKYGRFVRSKKRSGEISGENDFFKDLGRVYSMTEKKKGFIGGY